MALRPYQRVLIGLASAAGYSPPPVAWRDQLPRVNGDFRRSVQGLGILIFIETMVVGAGASLAIASLWGNAMGQDALFFGGMSVVLVALGLYLVSRNRIWYRFAGGSITALRGGKVLWSENLADLEYVVYTKGQLNSFLTLHWPRRRRRIELYTSLRRELSPSVTARAAHDELG